MSDGGPHEPTNLLDRYIDGLLSPAERDVFEARMRGDDELRAQLEVHQRIEASLFRLFAAPLALKLPSIAPAAPSPIRLSLWARLSKSPFAAVAALLFIALATWQVYLRVQDAGMTGKDYPDSQVWRSIETVYQAQSRPGAEPSWPCKSDQEFAVTFHKNLGQGLLMTPLPADVQSLGVSYTNTLSPKTVYYMARRQGKVILVFADRLANDSQPSLSDPKLHWFRKQTGSIVLYEVSPFDKALLLDLFYEKSVPKDWLK
jgi:hypothetical protein